MTMPRSATLPRNDDGAIITSASFGECWAVKIQYNTNADGSPYDPAKDAEEPVTLHGPFDTEEEAVEWMDAYPDGDTDLHDITVITMNRVRPIEGNN